MVRHEPQRGVDPAQEVPIPRYGKGSILASRVWRPISWILVFLLWWALLMTVHALSYRYASLDQAGAVLGVIYRTVDVLCLPFVLAIALLFPPESHYTEPYHYLGGTGLSAILYLFLFYKTRHILSRRRSRIPNPTPGDCFHPEPPAKDGPASRGQGQPSAKARPGFAWRTAAGVSPPLSATTCATAPGRAPPPAPPLPPLPTRHQRPSTSRRSFMAGSLAISATVVGSGLAYWATFVEPLELRLRTYRVSIPDLPPSLHGIRVAHISDSHLGPYTGMEHIQRAIALLNSLNPHVAVLTGDYIYRNPRAVAPGIDIFRQLRSSHGTLAVLGNHEHWIGAQACRDQLARAGIPLLENTNIFLTPQGLKRRESPGESLAICGLADIWEGSPDVEQAISGLAPGCPRILLVHNPDAAEILARPKNDLRFDLQLSGHTHGGQVAIPWRGAVLLPSDYGTKYAGGLVSGPGWPVIVSRGLGTTVAPVRFLVPPEVGMITLLCPGMESPGSRLS